MTRGLTIDGAGLTVQDGARVVATTGGTLVNLLPSEFHLNTTLNVVFPDFTKDYCYNWWWITTGPMGSQYAHDNGCQTQQTIPEQQNSADTVLAPAPEHVDWIAGLVRINRTSAPTHTWGGSTINVLSPVNRWMPFAGAFSLLCEAEAGMSRKLSVYLDDGNLMLRRVQSVSEPPGGYGTYGDAQFGVGSGGEWVYGSQPGIPVVPIITRNSDPNIESNAGIPKSNHRRGSGSGQTCALTTATNFSSTYRIELALKFGRRSP